MTPARLHAILALLRWSNRDLSAATGWNERTVRRWGTGAYAVPADVEHWLERVAALFEELPAPRKERKNISRETGD